MSMFLWGSPEVKATDMFSQLKLQYFTSKWTFCLRTSPFIAILVLHIPGLCGRMAGFRGALNIITTLSLTPFCSCCCYSNSFQNWPGHLAPQSLHGSGACECHSKSVVHTSWVVSSLACWTTNNTATDLQPPQWLLVFVRVLG